MLVIQAIAICKSGADNAFRTASDNASYKANPTLEAVLATEAAQTAE